jgi:hypothetical protein
MRRLPGNVRHHAEQRGLVLFAHEPMIGTAGPREDREQPTAPGRR